MCRLIKNNKRNIDCLCIVSTCSARFSAVCLIKIYLTIYLIPIHFNSELCCLSISSSSFLPTMCMQASSRCARPKYALHAPSRACIAGETAVVIAYYTIFKCWWVIPVIVHMPCINLSLSVKGLVRQCIFLVLVL